MTLGLRRWQQEGHLHFITFSCDARKPYLAEASVRNLFLESLERTRKKYLFDVFGYVVMPEHVHLLISQPAVMSVASAVGALKLSVSKRSEQRPFWTKRYYGFNVYTEKKRVEKLRYMHRNPVTRGLVVNKEDWIWSSYSYYASGEKGAVNVVRYEELFWSARTHLSDGEAVAKVGSGFMTDKDLSSSGRIGRRSHI